MAMDRFRYSRRSQIDIAAQQPPRRFVVEDSPPESNDKGDDNGAAESDSSSNDHAVEELKPFMGVKMRRKASVQRDYRGDYLDVPAQPHLMKILNKRGDQQVLFADKVLKFTGSGKMKRRILILTDFAIYVIDPETDALKRQIALSAVEKMYLSELNDNFFAVIIPKEYDLLMASTRKTEIVTKIVEATKSSPDYDLEVVCSNRFEYNASADLVKEVLFEEVEGGVKTRILKKEAS